MRIEFNIKYRPQIESGEYKVETRIGEPVKILYWEFKSPDGERPILAAIPSNGGEDICAFSSSGKLFKTNEVSDSDLFIITHYPKLPEEIKKLASNDNELLFAAKVYEKAKKLFKQNKPKAPLPQEQPEEDLEKRKKECPFRTAEGCERYAGVISECTGACSWVVDYPKLKEIQDKQEQKPI